MKGSSQDSDGTGDMRGAATRIATVIAVLVSALLVGSAQVDTAETVYPLTFPVAGPNSWTDTWGAPRSEGRTHQGTDIFATKGTPVVAAASGRVVRIGEGERAGRYIVISHYDGWSSHYLHLDNDSPGTDDGLGGTPVAGIEVGVQVAAGDVIDFVGDSGNAESTSPHLHFELHRPGGVAVNPAPHLRLAESTDSPEVFSAQSAPPYQASGTAVVGHLDPGGGFAAGLAVHGGVAYVGTWGRPQACPNSGTRVIDVSEPTEPIAIAVLAGPEEFPATSTDGVWAGRVETEAFVGDLAVVSVRLCDTSERSRKGDAFRGFAIYDVTDPGTPQLLGKYHSGQGTQGANSVTVAVRADGTAVVSATVMQSFLHTAGALGDWRLIDISDPSRPLALSDWDYRDTLPERDRDRHSPELHIHSSTLSDSGESVWLAVWDAGLVEIELTDPTAPRTVAAIPQYDEDEGNAHSVAFDHISGVLIRSDENLEWRAESGTTRPWGSQTIYQVSDRAAIRPLGTFTTENTDLSSGSPAGPGYFTAHEAVLVNDIEYVSWYSDGVRIVDLADPASPTEIGYFVPPPTADPQAHFLGQGRGASFAMVWGVAVADGYIYLSDMNSGLWIVRHAGSGFEQSPSAPR
jgi:hypothetical protein